MDKVKRIRFNKYKSFASNDSVILNVEPNVTLLIGKNNSGKSSCLDIIETAFTKGYRDGFESLDVAFTITHDKLSHAFQRNEYSEEYDFDYYNFAQYFEDKIVYFRKQPNNTLEYVINQPYFSPYQIKNKNGFSRLASAYNDYTLSYFVRRIDAERNIVPEVESIATRVDSNGSGATNLIQVFITHSFYDENLVEKILLTELNKIMSPDSYFTNIKVQQVGSSTPSTWEIFLEEKDTGRFALSKSGSGLKTILLVLINLYLIPSLSEYKNAQFIYLFEELENNLHPALQRRLFDYLYEYSNSHNAQIFLTSHSHIAINCYFGKESTQIYHVTKTKNISHLSEINNFIDKYEILNDLDVKASDLLQSNGIIWVEGPSDRVYINRWLQEFCKFNYKEGTDYQFLYYGGRLLSHYSIEDIDDLINIMTTNRNAAIVIDSDKKSSSAKINDTKKRIKQEFEKNKLFCWITKGKEIENYLPTSAINEHFNLDLKSLEQYELFPEYIKKADKNFTSHKVDFAHKIAPYITKENSKNILDLENKINILYQQIQKWNS